MGDSDRALIFKPSDPPFRRSWALITFFYLALLAVMVVSLVVIRLPVDKLIYVAPFAFLLAAGYFLTRRYASRLHRTTRLILADDGIELHLAGRTQSASWPEISALRVGKQTLTIVLPFPRSIQVSTDGWELDALRETSQNTGSRSLLMGFVGRKLGISPEEMKKAENHPLNRQRLLLLVATLAISVGFGYWAVYRSHLTKNLILILALAFGLLFGLSISLAFRNAGLIKVRKTGDGSHPGLHSHRAGSQSESGPR